MLADSNEVFSHISNEAMISSKKRYLIFLASGEELVSTKDKQSPSR